MKVNYTWEQLEAMSDLPKVITIAENVRQSLLSLAKQQEEQMLL